MEKTTISEFLSEISTIVSGGAALLERVGYDDCLELYGLVECDSEDPNTEYLLKAADKIAYDIHTAAETLDFLKRREHKPIHVLRPVSGGRYGYINEWGLLYEFHCGHCFEALLTDDDGRQHWTPTSIEYAGGRYYLVRHSDVELDGLVIRDGR